MEQTDLEQIPLNSQNPNINPDTLAQVAICYRYSKIFCRMFSGFMYIALILFPWITEIILITQQTNEHRIITLVVCGTLQTIVSIYGGIKMGIFSGKSCCVSKNIRKKENFEEEIDELCKEAWCGCPTKYHSLFSSGYVIYFLPQWIATNMIITWALLGQAVVLPLYVHIMTYMPLLVYLPFLFVGCAFQKAIDDESDYSEI